MTYGELKKPPVLSHSTTVQIAAFHSCFMQAPTLISAAFVAACLSHPIRYAMHLHLSSVSAYLSNLLRVKRPFHARGNSHMWRPHRRGVEGVNKDDPGKSLSFTWESAWLRMRVPVLVWLRAFSLDLRMNVSTDSVARTFVLAFAAPWTKDLRKGLKKQITRESLTGGKQDITY